jgi:hypothetical protein
MLLAKIYVENGEALEADLLRYWGQDINEISLRRMRNLFFRLPHNSETYSEINETPLEARIWDVNTYMLANVIDTLEAIDYHFISSKKKNPGKPPKPFKRPGLKAQPKKKMVWPGKTIVDRGGKDG